MLLGAPMTETFAAAGTLAPTAFVATDTHELADGVKFILVKTGLSNPIATEEITTNTNKKTYATIKTGGSTTAVFEVYNFQANSMAATFQLKVNGKPFAMTVNSDAEAITAGTAANKIYTTFTVKAVDGKYELNDIEGIVVVDGTNNNKAIQTGSADAVPATLGKEYKADDLNEFNSTSTTLSFGAADVEGNVFSGLTPITLAGNNDTFEDGTYFVKGSKDDKTAFAGITSGTNAETTEAIAKKLTFVSITSAKWGLNTLTKGEGYKLEMVNGAAFFDADEPLAPKNAKFTLNEFDQLNCEGELSMTADLEIGDDDTKVMVVAVKASATDTKTYVTTINSTTSAFEEYINPQLGSNTYLAASDFLKTNAVSAYNVLFTSGEPVASGKQPYEYGRYLSVVVGSSGFELNATTPDSTNIHAPLSQWIATGFNGKYTLTLKSREGNQGLELQLKATDNAGEYTIEGGAGATSEIKNIVEEASDGTAINTLSKKTIKLVPVALTKNDGYLVLSKEEMSGAITLGFSGKSALAGEATYYLTPNAATPTAFKAALDGDATLKFTRVDDDKNVNLIENSYAYLDKDGKVMVDGKDSLYVPMYTLTYGSKPYYVKDNTLSLSDNKTQAGKYLFKEHISGKYGMAVIGSNVTNASNVADANAVSIKADDLTFEAGASLNNLKDNKFAYVSLELEDQNDYTTLEAVSRHATLENNLGAVSMQENKNGILEGILSVEPLTFWLDTADSEKTTPAFYISVGTGNNEDEVVTKAYNDEVRLFLFNPKDSATVYNEGSATISTDKKYILEGSTNLKAIFRPAALVAEDTLETVVDGELVTVVAKDADAAKGQVNGLSSFQFGIALADDDVEDEYVVKSRKNNAYLYSLNGKLGFTADKSSAMVFTLGEGDATANEAIAAEGVQVIGGQGAVTVQGAAGKVITVANILGQTIANQVAASDNVTIAAPAGIVVVAVEGDATKVVVK